MERRYGYLCQNLFGIGAIAICFLLLLPTLRLIPAGAQTQPTADTNREEFDARIFTFFDTLRRGNSDLAFNDLLRTSPLGTPDAIAHSNAMRTRVDELQSHFGNVLAWESLDTKRVGANIVLVRYILMYDQHPVIWTFVFYRKPSITPSAIAPNPNLWVLVEFHFDTDMKSLLR